MMPAAALLLEVEEATGVHALDELGDPLDALADRLGVPLTSRRPWLSAWIGAYPQYQPWVITAWDAHRLVGACLLAHRYVDQGIEVIALGQGRNDRTHLLASDGGIAEALARQVAGALQGLVGPWSLCVEQLPADDPVAAALVDELPGALLVPGGSVPGVDFSASRSADVHLSRNLRRQLQKCRNRIVHDGIHAEMGFTRVRDRLWEHLDEVEAVHRARDHDVGRTSDIDDPAGRSLWRSIIATHIALDEVEIATLRLDGELAAYVVSFLDHSTYRVFDGRFVTSWSRYSPGRLLEVATLAHAMGDRRFERLDWMNSIAPDKLISANTLEPTVHLVASSPSSALVGV